MATWSEFAAARPALASAIRGLVHQYGPGLGYLATVRPDGGPRVHPISPVIIDDGLYCFVMDSPKRRDLDRQQDPAGSGAGTPDGEGGADGVERLDEDEA